MLDRRRYRLISADGHFNEPSTVWTDRVPARYRDRAPRIERFEQGDAWVLEGVDSPMPFGWGACAGRPPEQLGRWARMDEINPGSYDPKARLEEMDADRVDAEVLYPSGGPVRAIAASTDVDYHHAMVRAYNDWLVEFCSHDPSRLGGAALVPNRGVEQAVAEVERLADTPGVVAYLLRAYPHGTTEMAAEDDPLWAAIQATGRPVAIHVSLSDAMPVAMKARTLPGTVHFYDAPQRMLEFIFLGVLDRFPDLHVTLAEVDMGWMPYFAQQADDNFLRHARAELRDTRLRGLPSEYMKAYFSASFITDPYAIENRQRIGVDRMMWSNDYPHITSDWPNSWKTINATFATVDDDDRDALLAGNAARIFGFDQHEAASAPA